MNVLRRVLAIKTVSVGDLSSSIVHPREVYQRTRVDLNSLLCFDVDLLVNLCSCFLK